MRFALPQVILLLVSLSSFFDSLWKNFSYDIAIDLGTANIKVLVCGKGVVAREPSIIVQHKKSKAILAVGFEAKKMLGKTPAILQTVRPLRDGVISDFDAAEKILRFYIQKAHRSYTFFPTKIPRPRLVVAIPSGVTEVERKAVIDAAIKAGSRKVYLIEEPMAAALGVGLPVEEAEASLIVDIGGGTTEIAVISLGGIVASRSLRIAGDELDEEIVQWLKSRHNILVGEKTAEDLKISLASAWPQEKADNGFLIRGRDLGSGLPKEIKITTDELREVILPIMTNIVENIKDVIEETPPELLSDLFKQGLVLTGGGSQLLGLDHFLSSQLKIPVKVAEEPMLAVVRGCGKCLDNSQLLEKVRVGVGTL